MYLPEVYLPEVRDRLIDDGLGTARVVEEFTRQAPGERHSQREGANMHLDTTGERHQSEDIAENLGPRDTT